MSSAWHIVRPQWVLTIIIVIVIIEEETNVHVLETTRVLLIYYKYAEND